MASSKKSTVTDTKGKNDELLIDLLSQPLKPKLGQAQAKLATHLNTPSRWRLVASVVVLFALSYLGFSLFFSGLQSIVPFIVLGVTQIFYLLRRDFRDLNFLAGTVLCSIVLVANVVMFYFNYDALHSMLLANPIAITPRYRFLLSAISAIDAIMVSVSLESVKPNLLKLVGETEEEPKPQPFYTWIVFVVSVIGGIAFGALAAASPGQ